MVVFESERLIFRRWDLGDAEEAFLFYGDPDVSKYIGHGKAAFDVESVQRMLGKLISHEADYGFMPLALVCKKYLQINR